MADEVVTQTNETTARQELTAFLQFLRQEAESGVASTKALVKQEAPLVVRELIAYKRATSTTAVGLGLLLALVAGVLLSRKVKGWMVKVKDTSQPYGGECATDANVAKTCVCIGLILIGTVVACSSLHHLYRAWLAPRLIILDYVRGLL